MRVLLIEDDGETAGHIITSLTGDGHSVDLAVNGHDGLTRGLAAHYDAIIADRMLPGLDGLAVVRKLRAEGSQIPVLFLTALGSLDDRVEGLLAGADDYLTKPFAAPELAARLMTISRRTSGAFAKLKVGDLEMDLARRTVQRGGRPVLLQAQEFRLLEYLMRHAGRVVTRDMLLENVWNIFHDPRTNIVETHISRLRAKVNLGQAGNLIHTVRNFGYVIRED